MFIQEVFDSIIYGFIIWLFLYILSITSGLVNYLIVKSFGLNESIDNIRSIEGQMYSDYLRVAGTVDLVAEYNGKLSVIDWKTSLKPKKEEWVIDYYLQLVAYAEAHNEIYGTNIKEGHVFMCSRELQYQQFDVWPHEYDEWREEWYKRLYTYYDKHF